ncbi:hypothetical protein C8R42DRAFT_670170 [Lentinula raphanica]|nr:hypothetical protein C8R42DRAFT_670170 [Lentinula raphanica]
MPTTIPRTRENPNPNPIRLPVEEFTNQNLPDVLPNELLAKIFRAGVDLERDEKLPRSLITYCGVNSRWRAVCHQSPELWTNINIPLYHPRPETVVARVTTWLERSRSCLLDISFTITLAMLSTPIPMDATPDHTQHDEFEVMRGIEFVLVPHIPRIRRFYFGSELPFFTREVLLICIRLATRHAPQLTDISLKFEPLINPNSDRLLIKMDHLPNAPLFRSAPNLRHQTLHGVEVHYPLHGLSTLELFDVLPNQPSFRYLSTQSPALEELRLLRLHPMTDAADLTQSKFSFPALRSLVVSFAPVKFVPGTCVLALMSSPNLRYLEIRGTTIPDPATSLPDPAHLTQLHTLRLREIMFENPTLPGVNFHDTSFFLALTSVRDLQLIDTAPQALFPKQETKPKRLLRSRSGELRVPDGAVHPTFRANELDHRVLSKQKGELSKLSFSAEGTSSNPGTTSESHSHWPNITTITLDTIRARDVVWLCELIASRPEIDTVYLSHSAKRHLTSSVTMWKGDHDQEDRVLSWDLNLERKNLTRTRPRIEMGDMDPVAWLKQRVKVREYHPKGMGFLG